MDPPCVVVSETDGDKSGKNQTPLWRLAEAGDLDRVKMALTAEAEVLPSPETWMSSGDVGWVPLALSCVC